MPERRRDHIPHQPEHRPLLLGTRQPADLPCVRPAGFVRHRVRVHDRPRRLRQQTEQRAGPHGREPRQQPFPVGVHDDPARLVPVQHLLKRGERVLRRQRDEPTAPQRGTQLAVGRHAFARPRPPGDRRRDQPVRTPTLRQRVENGVRGGVGALPDTAPHPGDGREQHERVEVEPQLPCQHVQMTRTIGLGGQHRRPIRRRQPHDVARLEHTGRVEHRTRTVTQQHLAHRTPVGRVTRLDRHPRTALTQLRRQLGRSRGVFTPTARQYDVIGSPVHEPPGDPRPERTGTAGDEHGAGGPPRLFGGPIGGQRHHTAPEHPAVADRDLILAVGARSGAVRGQHGAQCVKILVVMDTGEIHQSAPPVRQFEGDHLPEAPYRRLPWIEDRIHRTLGHEPEHRTRRSRLCHLDGEQPRVLRERDRSHDARELGML